MNPQKTIILITGSVASGKTRLARTLSRIAKKRWRTCGFTSPAASRPHRSGRPAASYGLSIIGRSGVLPWARRNREDQGFEFCDPSRAAVDDRVRSCLDRDDADMCFLDEIGHLEVQGRGFADLFSRALASGSCLVVVAVVKKRVLDDVVARFGITRATVVDLDRTSPKRAIRLVRRRLAQSDAERVGVFAGVSGLVEIGLGSTLHAYRIPLSGHLLQYIQNLLLIAFGKALGGRGLVRIALISAMLKAFSPAGARFKPMACIFLQGAVFGAPVAVLGWSFLSALTGSVLMGWFTLGLALALDYVTFGQSIFDAFSGAIDFVSSWLGVSSPGLSAVLFAAFVVKGLISGVLAVLTYSGNTNRLVQGLLQQGANRKAKARGVVPRQNPRRSLLQSASGALMDILRPRFAATFVIMALLLLFFANLSGSDFWSVALRGLGVSYLGFVVLRQVDFRVFGRWLDRRAGLNLSDSLPVALGMLDGQRPDGPGAQFKRDTTTG